jgi:glycine/D-amino acid oxidase-like deaminating enzyme
LHLSAPTQSNWYEVDASPVRKPALTFDLDVDVCVVGAGLAGLTAAYEVARRGWSVVVLEADRIAGGASGCNTGVVAPGFACAADAIVERIGTERAGALWRLSEEGVDYVREMSRVLGGHMGAPEDSPGTPAGLLDVSRVDDGDAVMARLVLLAEFGAAVEGWPVERVRAVLSTDHYFHAIHFPTAFQIQPLTYARALATAAEIAGARLFEETAAHEIDPAGVRKRITTSGGRVRAAHVVLAGNVGLSRLAPTIAETVMPLTGAVAVTHPLGERLISAITWRGAVGDAGGNHYHVVDDDRLMWSGPADAWPRDLARSAAAFGRDIARIYPQFGEVTFSHVWSAPMGYAVHSMPQVGEVSPGVWLASAFGRQGLAATAMAGKMIAAAIVDGDDRWRAFLPYELVWAGGRLGRAVVHAGAWIDRVREDVQARAARRREALQKSDVG